MKRVIVLGLVVGALMAANAAATQLLVEEGFATKQPTGWVTDDWDDDIVAPVHQYKYTNLKDTGTQHGTYPGSKAGILQFNQPTRPGCSMALVKTFNIDTADGNTFDASIWFDWKGDHGGTVVPAQNAKMGVSIKAGGHAQFFGNVHWDAPGISVSNVLSGITGNSQWVQDTAPTLVVPAGTTQITVIVSAYHPNPSANFGVDIGYDDLRIVQTPEPATIGLLMGVLPLLLRRRR